MNQILFLDLETTRSRQILNVGALYGGHELHEKSTAKLEEWLAEAKFICGHNILEHDIPILEKMLGKEIFESKVLIDTLLWSPILFATRPYHKLVKGYKLVNEEEYANPLSDCKLTGELLRDELEAFHRLPEELKTIYFYLLKDHKSFNSFFQLINLAREGTAHNDQFHSFLSGKICSSFNFSEAIKLHPVELSYAVALINSKDNDSICSPWVVNNYPETDRILEEVRFNNCESKDCHYCENKLNPVKGLREHFSPHTEFRSFDPDEGISLQEKTVRAGLQKSAFVAVFPTGGGKSLTFQLPALMIGQATRQLTVVISPLVSLMKDQVDILEAKFHIIKAVAINGLLSPLERKEAIERVEDGRASILYISPESLRSPSITNLLKKRSIARFVIDEAHCFSSWGQDFRVDYLYIGDFISELQKQKCIQIIPVSCFTATAKPQVIEDIKNYFKVKLDLYFTEFITRADRKNLQYEVIDIPDPERKMYELRPLLERCGKPAIVYASRTKKVKEIHDKISEAGLSVTYFHGKLEKDEKVANQNAFMKGEKDIIVATSAFGMGVDKDDVRTIVHYDISDSLENYIQEAGRAGRKEKIQAKCYILFHEDDLNKHFSLLQSSKINLKEIQQIWSAIKYMTKFREEISNSALEIAQNAGWDTEISELETKVKSALAVLEDQGFLKRKQNSPRIFANSLLIRNAKKAFNVVNQSECLTEKQKEICLRLIQRLIKDDECRVDYLADILNISIKDIQNAIRDLRELELLGDKKDLSAFIKVGRAKDTSQKKLAKVLKTERALVKVLTQKKVSFSFRGLNQNLIDEEGLDICSEELIKNIIDYWDRRKFVSKKRIDRQNERFEIVFSDQSILKKDLEIRHKLSSYCFTALNDRYEIQEKSYDRKEDIPIQFSLHELKKENKFFGIKDNTDIKSYEEALIFLNHTKVIELKGGFMVVYNKLNISDVDRHRIYFKMEDYLKMKKFYEQKIQQIHIVGEYAKKLIADYQGALTYVNDYFTLSFKEFKDKYFSRQQKEISRAITNTKYKNLIGNLDTSQNKIIECRAQNILVLAGPGSGKTRVLINKIASLLLLEDIKPEQFLMLTFSKVAVIEFRNRIFELIPEYARLIKISTFHGYCFELLGQLGSIEKSQHVIPECIDAIEKEAIDITTIVNKSVLLLDEFQDVDEHEWKLAKVIKRKAGHLRIIAVGDDDQNIYQFRGATNQHMKEFRDEFEAFEMSLLRNYRSRSGIVDLNNQLLNKIPCRLKEGQLLEAKNKEYKAKIKITQYGSRDLIEPVVEDIINTNNHGTTALLVRRNEHALLAATLLKNRGLKVRLLAGLDGFRLNCLWEMRDFDMYLHDNTNKVGLIYQDVWADARSWFNEKFGDSIHNQSCNEVFNLFEKSGTTYELAEWRDFICQIKMEDAVNPESEIIIVTTMHKSKGKEFDNVYIMMEDYETLSADELRLLYVATSRAKERLHIHVNSPFFRECELDEVKYKVHELPTSPPDSFELILGLKDINLNSARYKRAKSIIANLKTGDKLVKGGMSFNGKDAPCLAKQGIGSMLLFSRKFNDTEYRKYLGSGYDFDEAVVEYVVYWYDSKKEENVRIILPKLFFRKK